MAEPSATLELGDAAYGSDPDTVTYEAAEAINAGDAVDINAGQVRAANSGDTGAVLAGVAAEAASEAGDMITVYVGGRVVANAGGSLTAGSEVGSSTTDGQLAGGTNVRGWIALTDSGSIGGLSHGAGLGANAAVVDLG